MNTIGSWFEKTAQTYPSNTAIETEQDRISYQKLLCHVQSMAAALPEAGSRIGVVLDHGIEQIETLLAILYSGSAYVPAEPFLPDERIEWMMKEPGVKAIVTSSKYSGRLKKFGIDLILIDTLESSTESLDHCLANPDSLAYILYTSGSTGKPKGVMVTNANVCHYVRAFRHEFHPGPDDAMLQYSVCSFDIFTEEVFTTLLSGARLVITKDGLHNDIDKLMDYVSSHGVTEISGFPYLLQKMNALPAIPQSLRLLISGGDVLRADYVDHLLNENDRPMIYNTYGPSETTVCASYFHVRPGSELEDGTYPIGKPVLETEIRIEDKEHNTLEPGHTGELIILGQGLSDGYCGNREEENKAFYIESDGRRAYSSGDLGYVLPDGNIAFLGRKDDQVMITGRRVEPAEVQSVIASLPGVYQVHVAHFQDGHNLSHMAAYVVFDSEQGSLDDLIKGCQKALADYMIPEVWIETDTLPLNINGKVDSEALPVIQDKDWLWKVN